jgi:hypothetical protein
MRRAPRLGDPLGCGLRESTRTCVAQPDGRTELLLDLDSPMP